MMLYLRYAEKDIRMLLRSKKMLFNLLFSLSIPTIYMMLASDPVLSSTSTIPLTGMPAFSAMTSSIIGGELVYFLLINDRESAIDDILLASNIGKLKLTIVRVMVSCILTIITVNVALVMAGILNFYSILPMIRVTMWSLNLCIDSILNTLLVVMLEQAIILLNIKKLVENPTISLVLTALFLLVINLTMVFGGRLIYILLSSAIVLLFIVADIVLLNKYSKHFSKSKIKRYNIQVTGKSPLTSLIKKDIRVAKFHLLNIISLFLLSGSMILLQYKFLADVEYVVLVRIAMVFLSLYGTLNIVLPATRQDVVENMQDIIAVSGMQRWKYILSKMIISVFVAVSGLIIIFTGSFFYCGLTESSFILDMPAALLCCLSSLFSSCLCIILTESVVSKREDRIISLIITIATIIVHVLMALLLPY